MKADRFRVRVWDKENGRMYYPNGATILEIIKASDECDDECWLLNTDHVMMLSTGLDDTDGCEIFEGDIVRWRTKGGYSVRGVSVVKYFDYPYCMLALTGGGARYSYGTEDKPLGSSGSSTPYKPYTWASYRAVNVIGNIYAHPELLEK